MNDLEMEQFMLRRFNESLMTETEAIIYLHVPFSEKNRIKSLGGKWDISKKCWYIYDSNNRKQEVLMCFNVRPY